MLLVKKLATFASMLTLGVLLFTSTLLFWEGKPHPDKSHWGLLSLAVGILGFLAPAVVVGYLHKRGYTNAPQVAGALALMVVSGVITFAVGQWFFWSVLGGMRGVPSWQPVAAGGIYLLTGIGFLVPGIITWLLHRKR